MSTLNHPLQHISGKDHDRRLKRSLRHCQHWRPNNQKPPLCWWYWWLSRRGRRTGKFSWASWQSLHSPRHGAQCGEDQADDKQHQWHQYTDQNEWTETWDSHKLQLPGFSYNWWGFQAWDTLQCSSSIDKAETSLDWQEYSSQLQDTADALPCHIHLPVCLSIMDPHSRAQKKTASHGNEMLPQDTTHLIQRLIYQRGSPCQDPAGNGKGKTGENWLRNHLWCPNDPRGWLTDNDDDK